MSSKPPALHIAFLDSWHTDRELGSGSAVAISGLAGGLRALGHQVSVIRPDLQLPLLDATRLAFNLRLAARLRAAQVDLIVGFDFDGCFLDRLAGRRYVVALKGVMADEQRYETGWQRVRFSLLSRLEGRNARRADRVIVTSEHSRRVALEAYGLERARVGVVPEGIDVAAWADLPADDRLPGAPPVIVSVARQYRRKNTATLVRAMTRVREAVPGVRLRVIGDGPELPRLTALAASLGLDDGCTSFHGSVGGLEAVQRELTRADVFCLPSRQEGFGIALLEAMAAGLPIVASDTGATPEVAPHGEVALLVGPDDVEGLAHALVRLLTDGELRARFSVGGRQRWRRYAWPTVATRFLAAACAA